MIASWALDLADVPFLDGGRSMDGADCWGLVYLAQQKLGVDVPSFGDEYATAFELRVVEDLIERERSFWTEVPFGSVLEIGDILVFIGLRSKERGSHVGVVVGDGLMLHMHGKYPTIETYLTGRWATRLLGAYRANDV